MSGARGTSPGVARPGVVAPGLAQQWHSIDQPQRGSWLRRADVFDALLIFSLFSYAYVYFFPYSEGISQAPTIFFLAKYFVWLAVLAVVLAKSERYRLTLDGLPGLACVFGFVVLITHAVHVPQHTDARDIVHLGNLLIFLPLVVLLNFHHAQRLLDLLPPIMTVQVLICFVAVAADVQLWEDNAFVGLLSNPNSFALALNLALFRVLARRRSFTALEVLQMSLLAIGIVLTRSNSQLVVFVLGVASITLATGGRRLLFVAALAAVVPAGLILAWSLDVIATRAIIDAVLRVSALAGGEGFDFQGLSDNSDISLSVSLREQIHLFAWEFLQRASPAELLLGDSETRRYHLFDSQYLMIAVNYGLVPLGAFLLLVFTSFFQAWVRMRRTGEWFDLLAMMAFGITFAFSRVLYYYPINVLYLACLVHTSAAMRALYVPLSCNGLGTSRT